MKFKTIALFILIFASIDLWINIEFLHYDRMRVVGAIITNCEKEGHFNFKDKTIHCIVTDRDQNEQTEKEAQKPNR